VLRLTSRRRLAFSANIVYRIRFYMNSFFYKKTAPPNGGAVIIFLNYFAVFTKSTAVCATVAVK
jgi:hypothetical protein